MPIHKVSGGYKWGGKGHTYASRKGAEKQAAAAYANGYTGKSLAGKVLDFVIKQLILKAQPMDKESAFAIATAMCQKLGYNDFSEGSIGRQKRGEIADAIMREGDTTSKPESLPYNQGTFGVSTGTGVIP